MNRIPPSSRWIAREIFQSSSLQPKSHKCPVPSNFQGLSCNPRSFNTFSPASNFCFDPKAAFKFSLDDYSPGAHDQAMQYFEARGVRIAHVEMRLCKETGGQEYSVDVQGSTSDDNVKALLTDLKENYKNVTILKPLIEPWFPRTRKDLELITSKAKGSSADLVYPHPGAEDKEYKKKRQDLSVATLAIKYGDPIPIVDYTPAETRVWKTVYEALKPLHKKYACQEYLDPFALLEAKGIFRADTIPQLRTVSLELEARTGMIIWPVQGIISPRGFFYGLAHGVFFATQYMRHPSKPFFTPEPDIIHEMLGHIALFYVPRIVEWTRKFASGAYGATDAQIREMSNLYWFGPEFGLCWEGKELKAKGAGLLSSVDELLHSMSIAAQKIPWNSGQVVTQTYDPTVLQKLLFTTPSFPSDQKEMLAFLESSPRRFKVRYNPVTQAMEADRYIEMKNFGSK